MTSWWRPLPLLLLVGCVLTDEDLDGDGFTVEDGDCNDLAPDIHPAAEDPVDDDIDQDCSGVAAVLRVEGQRHVCELSPQGLVACSGSNEVGQLEVPPVEHVVDLAAGAFHTCALLADGTVICWGDDRHGQASPPVRGPYSSVEAGGFWSIGVLEPRARAICWGRCAGI